MSAKNIRNALGLLQDDPDSERAWEELRTAVDIDSLRKGTLGDVGMTGEELGKLLEKARRAHETRREYDAVASILEIELLVVQAGEGGSGSARDIELATAYARVLDEYVLDDARAVAAY